MRNVFTAGWVVLGFLLFALACSSSTSIPGNAVIGTFEFNALLADGGFMQAVYPDGGSQTVPIVAPDAGFYGFTFSATLSFQTPKPPGFSFFPAWVTAQNVSRDAGFDGQFLTYTAEAPRAFEQCSCGEGINVTETFTVAVLSEAQAVAAGNQCPPNVLDGGLPLGGPLDLSTEDYVSPLVCGQLVDALVPAPDAGCYCLPASASIQLSGARQ